MSGVVLMPGVVQAVLSMDCWLWEIKNLLRAVAFSIAVAAVELAVDSVGIVCLGSFFSSFSRRWRFVPVHVVCWTKSDLACRKRAVTRLSWAMYSFRSESSWVAL